MAKRTMDLFGSIIGVICLAPLFGVIAIFIKAESPGPVFFRQERVGRGCRTFRIFKFRSMTVGAENSGSQVTSATDNRITRVGAFLRRHKLDEYPQLLNVLLGQMSLVGPRPEVPRYVQHYPEKFAQVMRQKPGMTHRVSLMLRNEEQLLAEATDPEKIYIEAVLPWKLGLYLDHGGHGGLWSDLRTIWNTVFCRERHLQNLVPTFDAPLVANVDPYPRHIPVRKAVGSLVGEMAETGSGRA